MYVLYCLLHVNLEIRCKITKNVLYIQQFCAKSVLYVQQFCVKSVLYAQQPLLHLYSTSTQHPFLQTPHSNSHFSIYFFARTEIIL
jgi:hypothetical protein